MNPVREETPEGIVDTPLPQRDDPAKRSEALSETISKCADDVRFRVAKTVRGLLQEGNRGSISPEECSEGAKSIKVLAETLRNAAALVDNLHELARVDVALSRDIAEIAADIADLVHACRDFEALRLVPAQSIGNLAKRLDEAAQVVEKSEEVLSLVQALAGIEVGVNNVGLTRESFKKLSGSS